MLQYYMDMRVMSIPLSLTALPQHVQMGLGLKYNAM